MANYTATSDMTLEECITAGSMVNYDNLTINDNAVVTCDKTPSILMGSIYINRGKFLIDGQNIVGGGNSINFIGAGGDSAWDEFMVISSPGTFQVKGAWKTIGTTDGSDSQVIDLSAATGSDLYDGDNWISWLAMIQVETGRRLTFDNPSSAATSVLAVGDWVYLSSDRSVMGKIKTVTDDYLVLWYLTGTLANDDQIQVRKIVDNYGPDLQVAWIADMDGADTKESGVYQEFGNCYQNDNSHIAAAHHGVGGFVFTHKFKETFITLGSSAGATGGFVAPSGCDIRVPNVMMSSAGTTDYAAGNCSDNSSTLTDWWGSWTGGGYIDLSILNLGNALINHSGPRSFVAEYVGATELFGAFNCPTRTMFTHCVMISNNQYTTTNTSNEKIFQVGDNVLGTILSFCMNVQSTLNSRTMGGSTSAGVVIEDCIATQLGQEVIAGYGNYSYILIGCTDVVFNNNVAIGSDHASTYGILLIDRCKNVETNMFLYSATQEGTLSAVAREIIDVWGSSDVIIVGIETIEDGIVSNELINITDSIDVKIRCFGMIDDKVDFGSGGTVLIWLYGLCDNIHIARMWKIGGSIEEAIEYSLSAQNVTLVNCSADYASMVRPRGQGGIKTYGLHGGSGTPGGGTGWRRDDSNYGYNFKDVFKSDTLGVIGIQMSLPIEGSDETTIVEGDPWFDGAGYLNMESGDEIIFEMHYFAKGHTGFNNGDFTTGIGSVSWFNDEMTNTTIDFQYDINDGSGWNGSWLDLRTSSNLTSISVDPGDGIKLKLRLTATGTQSSISFVLIDTTTSIAAQKANFYPIDQIEVSLILTNIESGSEISVKQGSYRIVHTQSLSGTEFEYIYDSAMIGKKISYIIINPGKETIEEYLVLPSSNQSIPVAQIPDMSYI